MRTKLLSNVKESYRMKLMKESKLRESDEVLNDLIREFQTTNDDQVFSQIVDHEKDFLSRMTSKYFISSGDKNDIKQEALWTLWDAVRNYNFSGNFEAYAGMLIKRNLSAMIANDTHKKNAIISNAYSIDQPREDANGNESTLGDTLSNGQSSEDLALGNEGEREIRDFIQNQLSDIERLCISEYIDGYKVSEIAANHPDMKYKSIENAIRRTKEKLTNVLKNTNEVASIQGNVFTDREMIILKKALEESTGYMFTNNNNNQSKCIRDSVDYSKSSLAYRKFYDEFENLSGEIEDVEHNLKNADTSKEYYDILDNQGSNLYNKLEDIIDEAEENKLISEEEFDSLSNICIRLHGKIKRLQYIDPPYEDYDPYRDRGMSPEDFY